MQRRVSAGEARQRLGELLEGVFYRGDEVVIERAGKAMGVVIPMERYQQIEAARQRFWQKVDELRAENAGRDIDFEAVDAMVQEEIAAYRREQRAAEQAGE